MLGRNHITKLDGAAGTLVEIQDYLDSVSISREAEPIQGPSMGVVGREHKAGLEEFGYECEAVLDETIDEIFYDALAEQKSIEDSPAGTATNSIKDTGEVIGVGYEIEIDFEKEVRGSFSADGTGVLTESYW